MLTTLSYCATIACRTSWILVYLRFVVLVPDLNGVKEHHLCQPRECLCFCVRLLGLLATFLRHAHLYLSPLWPFSIVCHPGRASQLYCFSCCCVISVYSHPTPRTTSISTIPTRYSSELSSEPLGSTKKQAVVFTSTHFKHYGGITATRIAR
jgi:hypothetical protein